MLSEVVIKENNSRSKPWTRKQYLVFGLSLGILSTLGILRFEMAQTVVMNTSTMTTSTRAALSSHSLRNVDSSRSVGSSSSSSSSSSSDDTMRVREEQETPKPKKQETKKPKTTKEEVVKKVVTTTKKEQDKKQPKQTTSDKKPNNAKKTEKKNSIKQISLIGERNSGTKWIWAHLEECFNHSIPVLKQFTRYKHWFQNPDYTRYPHDTLVLAQFRNPYDWLRAMQRIPHHSPAHLFLDWPEFLTKTWTTPRIGKDLLPKYTNDTMCQQHFKYRDAVSCTVQPLAPEAYGHKLHYSEDKPFYEMRNDGSGEPYRNIMEFRTAKIENFLEVRDWPGVADYWILQYEFLLHEGTTGLLQKITEYTGVPAKCDAYPQQLRRSRNISDAFVNYVTQHMDWTVEESIGYFPREMIVEETEH